MEISTEIRWFFPDKMPDLVQSWFFQTPRFGDTLTVNDGDERIDLYLLTEGRIDISPKLREGKLEIKVRNQVEEFADPTGFYSGLIERWEKWEWQYTDTDKKEDEFEDKLDKLIATSFKKNTLDNKRFNVWKNRFQRKFTIDSSGTVIPAGQDFIDEGFQAEVTELKVNDEDWWTMAFEIVENPKSPMKDPISKLKSSINWIFEGKEYDGQPIKSQSSFSYPEWLNSIKMA